MLYAAYYKIPGLKHASAIGLYERLDIAKKKCLHECSKIKSVNITLKDTGPWEEYTEENSSNFKYAVMAVKKGTAEWQFYIQAVKVTDGE